MGLPYFNFYTEKFLRGVQGMTPSEVGVYIGILARIYDADGPIKADINRLARAMSCPIGSFKKTLEWLIDNEKLYLVDGMLMNDRCSKELEKQKQKGLSASKSASARWREKQTKTKPDDMQTQSERNAIKDRRIKIKEKDILSEYPKENGQPSTALTLQDTFPDFWARYPKKIGKPKAEAAYRKAIKVHDPTIILAGLGRAIAADSRFQSQTYTPHPTSWLNANGFLDEHKPETSNGKSTPDSRNTVKDVFVLASRFMRRDGSEPVSMEAMGSPAIVTVTPRQIGGADLGL